MKRKYGASESAQPFQSMGIVIGRIQPTSDQSAGAFLLADPDRDIEVPCHADETFMAMARKMAGQLVNVEGWLSRESTTGHPLSIDNIVAITVLPEVAPGSFQAARGVAPIAEGDLLPEEAVQKLRDDME